MHAVGHSGGDLRAQPKDIRGVRSRRQEFQAVTAGNGGDDCIGVSANSTDLRVLARNLVDTTPDAPDRASLDQAGEFLADGPWVAQIGKIAWGEGRLQTLLADAAQHAAVE